MKNRYAFGPECCGDIAAIAMTVSLGYYELSTNHQNRKDFTPGSIEGDRRFQKAPILIGQLQRVGQPTYGIDQSHMFDDDALRSSSRA